jgi:hypothetical protein
MNRLQTTAAAMLVFTLAGSGCARNRNLPTQLAPSHVTQIGVNAYLWKAAIDTVSFAPLLQANPNSGVIITDWYAFPEKPDERFKCTVYILDARLRADGLNVAVFTQHKNATGEWIDAPSASETETQIENAILDKARRLRLSNLKG